MQGTQIQTNKQVQKTMRWGTQCPQVSKSQKLVNTKTDAHKGRPLKIEGRRAMAKTSNWFNHNYQLHTKCRAPKIVLLNQTSRVDTDSTRAYYKRDLRDLLEVHIHIKWNLNHPQRCWGPPSSPSYSVRLENDTPNSYQLPSVSINSSYLSPPLPLN